MATQAVTTTPTALADVTAGTAYYVENQGGEPVYLAIRDDAPGADELDRVILEARHAPGDSHGYATATGSANLYVWTPAGGSRVWYLASG